MKATNVSITLNTSAYVFMGTVQSIGPGSAVDSHPIHVAISEHFKGHSDGNLSSAGFMFMAPKAVVGEKRIFFVSAARELRQMFGTDKNPLAPLVAPPDPLTK